MSLTDLLVSQNNIEALPEHIGINEFELFISMITLSCKLDLSTSGQSHLHFSLIEFSTYIVNSFFFFLLQFLF